MKQKARYGHFDWLAPIYDHVFGGMDHDALAQHLQVRAGQLVLDIGGGTGRVAQRWRDIGARLMVVDPSPGMLAGTRVKELVAVRGLAEALPFAANSVDRIYVVDAFHHFADQGLAAREFMRVLQPGGRIVIEEPDLRRWPVKMVAVAEKLALMQSHFLSPPDLAQLFASVGSEVLAISLHGISSHVVLTKPETRT